MNFEGAWVPTAKRWTALLLALVLLAGAAAFAWIRYGSAAPAVAAVSASRMGSLASAGGAVGANPHDPILNQLTEKADQKNATQDTAIESSQTVSGTVSLAASLASQAKPDDTVFVFARPAEGSRMPLAMLRKQVRDLPLRFILDDSTAMSLATRLSQAGHVIVAARVTKSANAAPLSGDLAGHSAPVAVGSKGVTIEINEIVKE